jgi:hypothetical protein
MFITLHHSALTSFVIYCTVVATSCNLFFDVKSLERQCSNQSVDAPLSLLACRDRLHHSSIIQCLITGMAPPFFNNSLASSLLTSTVCFPSHHHIVFKTFCSLVPLQSIHATHIFIGILCYRASHPCAFCDQSLIQEYLAQPSCFPAIKGITGVGLAAFSKTLPKLALH